LHCAWTCDDNGDELAVEIRKMALKSMYKMKAQEEDEKHALILIEADLLRRSMQFDEVIRKFKDLILEDKTQNDIITFQIELSMNKDSDCHTAGEVVKK